MAHQVSFQLEPGEKLLFRGGRHWIALAMRAGIPFILWLINSVVFIVRLPTYELDRLNLGLFVLGVLLFLLIIYFYFDWRNDHLFVTTKRVVFEDEVFLISGSRQELLMEAIEHVIVETSSVIARQLDYGKVIVKTASRMRNIEFDRAAKPKVILKTIMDRVTPIKQGLAEDKVRKTIAARVLGQGPPPKPVAPVHLLPDDFFGQGFAFLFPPNPRKEGDAIIWHKHWLFAFASLLDPVLILGILIVVRVLVGQAGVFMGLGLQLLFVLALLGVLGWMIYRWVDWVNDYYMITPTNVLDVERTPLGREDRKQASLEAIQNVTADQPNIIARMLNYGDVFLHTAGGGGEFSFSHVPDPEQVQAVIFDYLESFKQHRKENERYSVLDLIRQYHLMQSLNQGQGEDSEKNKPPGP